MAAEIAGDDDAAGIERRTEELAYIDEERFFIHGSVERHRRGDGAHTKRGDEGRSFPMSARYACVAAFAPGSAPARAGHMRVRAGLADEHQPRHVKRRLVFFPLRALQLYVFALLLAGAQGFF